MNKFISLTGINVIAALRQMNLMRRRADGKTGWGLLYAVAVMLLVLMAMGGWIAFRISSALHPLGLDWLLLVALFFLIFMFVFSTSLYTVNSVLFDSTDTEQLLAYPLTKYQILFSKVSALVVENWLAAFAFALPFIGVYCYYVRPPAVFYPYAFVCVLIAPLIPLCLITVIGYIVSALTNGARFKSYLNVILTIGMVMCLVFGVARAARYLPGPSIASADTLLNAIKTYYPPAGYAVSALYHCGVADMLIAVAWNAAPFVVLCGVLSVFYTSLRSRVAAVRKVRSGPFDFGASSKLGAMTKKEFARLLSSPMYILNSCAGLVMMTIFAVMAGSSGKNARNFSILLKTAGLDTTQTTLIVFLFLLSLCCVTAPSISLEGKSLWIVKSCPVRPRTALTAKLLVHLSALIPVTAIDCGIVAFTMKTGLAGFAVILAACALFILLSGLVGLIYNLHYHRFDFYNDMQVVKNSASALLTMGTMLASAAAAILLYWLITRFTAVNFYVCAVLFMAATACVCLYLYRYIVTRGEELFRRL